MKTIYFTGKVYPERTNITILGLPDITVNMPGLNIQQ